MASAKKTVTLTLSGEEAVTLCAILGHVGGDPVASGRRHADSILDALNKVAVDSVGAMVGEITFADRQ